jgi:chloramphenicol 3-O phosphotransferase
MMAGGSVPRPRVIILNGVGSVGKSATAAALQAITSEPFLHIAMDAFIDMLPVGMFGHPDGLIFEVTQHQDRPSVAIRSGPVLQRAMQGMRHAVAAMAEQGNNLIVDEVMIGPAKAQHYRTLLARFDVRLVGLFAPLDVLEARERARGNRQPGLARWQFDRVHRGMSYDLEIDAAVATPPEIARTIRDAFAL